MTNISLTTFVLSSSVDTDTTEAETQGVSHMLLPDVFVLVSDEMEDDLSNNWTVSIESSPQRVRLPKKSGAHFQNVGVLFIYLFYYLP